MTVSELIKELMVLPGNAEVVISHKDWELNKIQLDTEKNEVILK